MNKIYYTWKLGYQKDISMKKDIEEYKKTSPFPKDFFTPLIKSISETDLRLRHSKCPAFIEWHRNTWIVKQPFTFNFSYSKKDKKILYDFKGDNFRVYFNIDSILEDIIEVQFFYHILFWTKQKNVWLEILPHPELSKLDLELIPGTFCFSEWIRPVSFGFKMLDLNKIISFKRDMSLYYIKFINKNDQNQNFSLEEGIPDDNLLLNFEKNMNIKFYSPNDSWRLMKKRSDQAKKCPFFNIFKNEHE